jgi:Flp pilus assembly pilin Flp
MLGQIRNKILADERGGEVLEYSLVIGLIVVASITVIHTVGTKALGSWNSVNTSLSPTPQTPPAHTPSGAG